MSIPLLDAAVATAYPAIAGLAGLLAPLGGAAATIVLCTAALRLLLLPLTRIAVRGERRRAALAPRVREVRRRYARDPARLRAELAALYADTSPLAGLLPLLLQAPFFVIWYRTFTAPRIGEQANALLAQPFLGAPLSTHLLTGGHAPAFVPLLVALALLATIAARRARRIAATAAAAATPGMALLPYLSLCSAAFLPLAAVLYLVATLTWTAAENAALHRGFPDPPATNRT
jgi:YidC/Oxa1 family membrane protein insertase